MSSTAPTPRSYFIVGAALLALLALTIGAAYIDLGPLNTVVALGVSLSKGTLILLFFMHLRYSRRIMWIFAGAGFFWLGIMLVLALTDYMSRGWR